MTNFLRATCERPSEREKNIKAVVQNAFGDRHDNRDLLVKTEFGISVKTDPVVIDARVLPAPKVRKLLLQNQCLFSLTNTNFCSCCIKTLLEVTHLLFLMRDSGT